MDDFSFELDDEFGNIETFLDKEEAIEFLKKRIDALDSWSKIKMKESAFNEVAKILDLQQSNPTYRADYLNLISQILPKDS